MLGLLSILKRFCSLPREQKKWLFSAYVAFAKWDICIRFLPYKWWRYRVFPSEIPKNEKSTLHLNRKLQAFIHTIEKAGRHHWAKMNCLRRCLVTQELLYQHGVSCDLCIGVRKSDRNSTLEAHSWLEVNGKPINDSEALINTYSKLMGGNASRQFSMLLKKA